MAEQRFGGDVRIYGKGFVEQQGVGDTAIVARLLLQTQITAARDRATHTGTQLAATISDLPTVIDAAIQEVVGAAPEALNTLEEIALRLADDADAAAVLTQMVTENRTDIDALTLRVDTAETDVDALQATDVEHTADIEALRTDLTTAQGNITTNTSSIAALRTDLTATQDGLTALTTRVDTAETDIEALRTDLDALTGGSTGSLTEIRSDLDALELRVDATELVANAAAPQTALDTEVTARTDADALLDARLDALEIPTIYKETLGNGTDSLLSITHNLNSQDIELVVRDLTLDGQRVYPVDAAPGANTATIDFGSYVPPADSIRVVVKAY